MRYFMTWAGFFAFSVAFGQNISTLAGTGTASFSGDNGPASAASFNQPFTLACDNKGDILVADRQNNRIRLIDSNGIVTTIAGNGSGGYSGDGGPATDAAIYNITGIFADDFGNILIADKSNNRVRKVNPTGLISTVAGTGLPGGSGDGGPATDAQLSNPRGVCTDRFGRIYIADQANNRIRMVDTTGVISTIAGNGTAGFAGDGGAATAAMLQNPFSVLADTAGNLYIADVDNERIRMINSNGIIVTVAGSAASSSEADGIPATDATLYEPTSIALDAYGTLYIADAWNNRIRAVNKAGIIYSIAGTGTSGFSGDGGPALAAELSTPYGVAVSKVGMVCIADYGNNRIRAMSLPNGVNSIEKGDALKLFPNPIERELNISLPDNEVGELEFEIRDLCGRVKFKNHATGPKIILYPDLIPGIYFVQVQTTTRSLLRQIVVE